MGAVCSQNVYVANQLQHINAKVDKILTVTQENNKKIEKLNVLISNNKNIKKKKKRIIDPTDQ